MQILKLNEKNEGKRSDLMENTDLILSSQRLWQLDRHTP
jgi:hypothetical protein